MKRLQDGDGGGEEKPGGGHNGFEAFSLRSVGSSGKLDKAPWPSLALGEPTRRWHRLQSGLGWKSMAWCPLLPALDLAPYLKAALILSFYFRVVLFPLPPTPTPLPLSPLYFVLNPSSLF